MRLQPAASSGPAQGSVALKTPRPLIHAQAVIFSPQQQREEHRARMRVRENTDNVD
jgi:hypothetical protein